LAIALLVVGTASFLPQTSSPLRAASLQVGAQSATSTVTTKALTTSSTANGSAQFVAGAPPGAEAAAIGAAASSSTTTTPAAAGAASSVPGISNQDHSGATAAAGTQGQQEPGSLLAVLPGESAGRVIATVSPLLIGLLVAALVYGAYARRQDSAP